MQLATCSCTKKNGQITSVLAFQFSRLALCDAGDNQPLTGDNRTNAKSALACAKQAVEKLVKDCKGLATKIKGPDDDMYVELTLACIDLQE